MLSIRFWLQPEDRRQREDAEGESIIVKIIDNRVGGKHIFSLKKKRLNSPIELQSTCTYVLLRRVTNSKIVVTNPFGGVGRQEYARS